MQHAHADAIIAQATACCQAAAVSPERLYVRSRRSCKCHSTTRLTAAAADALHLKRSLCAAGDHAQDEREAHADIQPVRGPARRTPNHDAGTQLSDV